tara:strand:+ start:293 stop:511 length:219 start_codon:yes stop_codon:yes gene_type:complete
METLKLSDDSISMIAQALQIAILTGTDVVDNLRSIRLVENNGSLAPEPEFVENWNTNIQKLLAEAQEHVTEE